MKKLSQKESLELAVNTLQKNGASKKNDKWSKKQPTEILSSAINY